MSVDDGDITMSIASTLIQACLSNVQKEFRQLEHWLNSLHPTDHVVTNDTNVLRELTSSIERLSKQYEVQQMAIHRIADRLDMLEGGHDIQINDDPWLASEELENTIVEPVDYIVHKEEPVSVAEPNAEAQVEPKAESQVQPPVQPKVESQVQPKVESQAEAQAQPQVQPQAEPQVQPQAEHVVDIAEEEDGVELVEITYKDVNYYKDSEEFVYGIDEEGQPTDQPVGIWKNKTQSIAFYRLK